VALAPFFDRVYGAVGGHLSVSRESLISALSEVNILITCGEYPSANDRWIAEMCMNLASRLYPRISISAPTQFAEHLRQLASQINPEIEFSDASRRTHSLCVGASSDGTGIYPVASGWVAQVRHSPGESSTVENPFSSAASAAIACAELFRDVFMGKGAGRDVSLSLLDFGVSAGLGVELGQHDLGDVLFVGVGAVGNAAVWALSRSAKLEGRLLLVDSEEITLSNLQRYVLAGSMDVDIAKVKLAKRHLDRCRIRCERFRVTLEQFAEKHKNRRFKNLCISVDNVAARRAAQALLPKLVLNGWTGDRSLGASWHVLSRDAACLACLYHPHGQGLSAVEQAAKALGLSNERAAMLWVAHLPLTQDDIDCAAKALQVPVEKLLPWQNKTLGDFYTDVVCGAVPIDVGGLGRVETVPLAHQSVLAGVLMAAELVKRNSAQLMQISNSEPLVTWDDILKPPPTLWTRPRAREQGCICGDVDYQEIYRKHWEA
jgi:hypothetical protein